MKKKKKLIIFFAVLAVLAVGALIAGNHFFHTSVRINSDFDVQNISVTNESGMKKNVTSTKFSHYATYGLYEYSFNIDGHNFFIYVLKTDNLEHYIVEIDVRGLDSSQGSVPFEIEVKVNGILIASGIYDLNQIGDVHLGEGYSSEEGGDTVVSEEDKPAIKQEKIKDYSVLAEMKEYDADGKLLKYDFYEKDGSVRTSVTYTYEGENLVSKVVAKSDGTFDYTKNNYDADGNLIEVYEGNSEDNMYLDEKNTYESGLIRERINYNEDGSIWDRHEYEYEDGRLIKDTTILEDGYIYRTYEYEYDSEGKRIRMTDTMNEYKCVYSYDEEERPVLEENYNDGEFSFKVEHKYGEYGETELIQTSADGEVSRHTKTEYDSKGRIMRMSFVRENGEVNVSAVWEHDNAGNLLRHVDFSGYEYTAEYNEYGYPVKVHDVCTDMMRNAGTYDHSYEYEYTYY